MVYRLDRAVSDATERRWGSDPYDADSVPQVPLHAWPIAFALLLTGIAVLASRRPATT